MRLLLIALLLCSAQILNGQGLDRTSTIEYSGKGYVVLDSNETVEITGIYYYADTSNIRLRIPRKDIGSQTDSVEGDATQWQTVPISRIRMFKVNRGSFWKGAATVGAGGFGVGYLIGSSMNRDNSNRLQEEDDPNRTVSGLIGGVIIGIPSAFVGGTLKGVFTKRQFQIDGNSQKLLECLAIITKKGSN